MIQLGANQEKIVVVNMIRRTITTEKENRFRRTVLKAPALRVASVCEPQLFEKAPELHKSNLAGLHGSGSPLLAKAASRSLAKRRIAASSRVLSSGMWRITVSAGRSRFFRLMVRSAACK